MASAPCHPNRLIKAKGLCGSCYDRELKQTNPQYKQNQITNHMKWRLANPEKWKIILNRRRLKESLDPLSPRKKKNCWLKRKYKITIEQYDELLKNQNNTCAICLRAPGKRPLHVDHCHKTGVVRGLLCHQCNWYLGTIDADKMNLVRFLKYINYNGEKTQ